MPPPTLLHIYLAETAGAAPRPVDAARVLADRGLEGDRYAAGTGSFSRWTNEGRAVTLIEQEALDAILADAGIDLRQGQHRRNLVTANINLRDLMQRKFRIGSATLRGTRICEPCKYLERLTRPGAFAAMKGRGGLRADIVTAGEIRVGDALEPL